MERRICYFMASKHPFRSKKSAASRWSLMERHFCNLCQTPSPVLNCWRIKSCYTYKKIIDKRGAYMSELNFSGLKPAKHMMFLVFVIAMVFVLLPRPIHANAAEPPTLIILVYDAPDDIKVELKGNTFTHPGQKKSVAWETYYVFYYHDIAQLVSDTLVISSGDETFETKFNLSKGRYNNIFTLSLAKQTLTPGTAPLRSILLVTLRVLLTLLIEGALFYIFGFREKRSWKIFLLTNLITQGALNIIIATSSTPVATAYFGIFLLEFLILIIELSVFMVVIKEHSSLRRAAYAIAANIASFWLGSYLISNLPV